MDVLQVLDISVAGPRTPACWVTQFAKLPRVVVGEARVGVRVEPETSSGSSSIAPDRPLMDKKSPRSQFETGGLPDAPLL